MGKANTENEQSITHSHATRKWTDTKIEQTAQEQFKQHYEQKCICEFEIYTIFLNKNIQYSTLLIKYKT
jgi:hypothetical protein